jgi:hypothetical protein
MQSKAATVKEYLAELPDDRRKALEAVRKVVRKNLDKAYVEGMQYGMVGYYVPHKVYPPGYHCDPKQPLPFAGMASQKNHMSLYLFCVYNNPELLAWFQKAVAKSGKKLNMGKSCIRFKKLEDLPLAARGRNPISCGTDFPVGLAEDATAYRPAGKPVPQTFGDLRPKRRLKTDPRGDSSSL